jgi:hypothetical protein
LDQVAVLNRGGEVNFNFVDESGGKSLGSSAGTRVVLGNGRALKALLLSANCDMRKVLCY